MNLLSRYPCEQQHDPSDCGVAALTSVAAYHGLTVNRARLRETTGTDPAGTTFLGLIKGAESLGFQARGLECTWEGLSELELPSIARVINKKGYPHLVVLYEISDDTVQVGDPAEGRVREMDKETFKSQWTGHMVELVPDSIEEIDQKDPRWKWLKFFLTPFTGSFVQALLAGVFFVGLGLITSFFAQYLVDLLHKGEDLHNLNLLFIGALVLILVRGLFGYLRGIFLIDISQQLNIDIVSTFISRILTLPFSFFARRQVGEILSRVGDSFKIRHVLGSHSLSLVIDMVMIIGAFLFLFLYSVKLALISLCFVPLFTVLTYFIIIPLKTHQHRARQIRSDLESLITETFSGAQTVKLFQAEDHHHDKCQKALRKMTEAQKKAEKWGLRYETLNTVLTTTAVMTVLWLGAYEVQSGALSLGQFVFFHSLLGFALAPFKRLAGVIDAFQDASVGLERITEYLEVSEQTQNSDSPSPTGESPPSSPSNTGEPKPSSTRAGEPQPSSTPSEKPEASSTNPEKPEPSSNKPEEPRPSGSDHQPPSPPSSQEHDHQNHPFDGLREDIEFDQVSFQYGYRRPVLTNISFRIPAGSTVAFVGESGSGKTTLSRLLSLLYPPTKGIIRYDGRDARHYELDTIRERIGIVEQEPFLFHDTMKANIAYGQPDADLEDVQEAARRAQIHDFVQSLPGTYDSMLGERGVNVSGGQRQRIAIARALLSDPDLLIFDEPTNHLDPKTEQMLSRLFQNELADKTIVLITHQLRIVTETDRIFVLGNHQLLESGTHEELLQQEGHYQQMWVMQNQ